MAKKHKYKPTGKTHVLKTITDLSKVVTEDNLPYLMSDLFLSLKTVCELKKINHEYNVEALGGIKWIDDGKSGLVGFEFLNNKKTK